MIVIPAIDLKDGQCVRLVQGRADEASVVADDPVETALRWQKAGASLLHIVDLDGAFEGTPRNLAVVEKILAALAIPVQMGGGLRSLDGLSAVLDTGVDRVILGTVAVEEPSLVRQAVERFGDRIVVGIDAHDGLVAVRGWVEGTQIEAVDLAERMRDVGVEEIIFTDIARDGTLTGPNLDSLARVASVPGVGVIAAGGVSSVDDLLAIKKINGVKGAIVGKALYSGHIDLTEAIRIVEGVI
ncbi:MAG: 1-(5-phosphoribosyl)-5-[(5-phosphoribosylamino)methylideneamino]imidazole-4-carboxamide isomerase [Limnochordia bacterium]|jgi:phosphoribosylformimino-5-aminoimidazole carboxamide ribotide isomerase